MVCEPLIVHVPVGMLTPSEVNAVLAALKIEAGDDWPGKKRDRPVRAGDADARQASSAA